MSKEDQGKVYGAFESNIVSYSPGLAEFLGSIKAALFVGQLLYWYGKGSRRDGWIYKTVDDSKKETGLSRYEQEAIIKLCEGKGFLTTKRKGWQGKRHFRLDLDQLFQQVMSWRKIPKLESGKTHKRLTSKLAENPHSNTKSQRDKAKIDGLRQEKLALLGQMKF